MFFRYYFFIKPISADVLEDTVTKSALFTEYARVGARNNFQYSDAFCAFLINWYLIYIFSLCSYLPVANKIDHMIISCQAAIEKQLW